METYGQAVRRHREHLNLSLRELARQIPTDHSYLSQIERGKRRGSIGIAEACDRALSTGGELATLFLTTASPVSPVEPGACGFGGCRVAKQSTAVPWPGCCPAWRPQATDSYGASVVTHDLDALVESARLSLHAPSLATCDQLDATVETFALTYSKHPPAKLFNAVHTTRVAVAAALDTYPRESVSSRMMGAAGWLSALLGNLSYHLDARSAAAAHWATAVHLGQAVDDCRLVSWTRGAQAMLSRAQGDFAAALNYGTDGLNHATAAGQKAQLLAWAILPATADLGRTSDVTATLAQALNYMDNATDAPGRFGFDRAELHLHAAEAHLALDDGPGAIHHGDISADLCELGRPGWAAATLTAARGHVTTGDRTAAAHLADTVLNTITPERLRATSRKRLTHLSTDLGPGELTDRILALPPLATAT